MSNRIGSMFVSPLMGTGALVLLVLSVAFSYAKHVREVLDAEADEDARRRTVNPAEANTYWARQIWGEEVS
jgi:hypothetical protein